jgi:hypothetical protein
MNKLLVAVSLCCLISLSCATTQPTLQMTQLQTREFQTRYFETADTNLVMKAMLNVLQDDGFIVKNAVTDLGLLTAEKTIDIENKGEATLSYFFGGAHAEWKKASVIECTGNVSAHGSQTKVRANFLLKMLSNKGGIMKVEQVQDEKYYQEFFAKLDKSIFLQKENL